MKRSTDAEKACKTGRTGLADRLADSILGHRRAILAASIILVVSCAMMIPMVSINFNLSDYLPDDSPSTKSLQALESSFSESIPNVSVYIPDVSIPEALDYKNRLKAIPGVGSVLWLDDAADIRVPLEMQNPDTVSSWYVNGGALFMLTVDQKNCAAVMEDIRNTAGPAAAFSGEAVNQAAAQSTTMGEISMIIVYLVPLVLIVLLLSTSSWFEPVLFLAAIGAAIVINEGTNIFLGEISYITRATSAILQLAVSIDYAVFLLHRYAGYRNEGVDVRESMRKAMVKSSSAIAASAATTVFGFLALTLMKFKIGPDMGFVLAKGVLASYISVMVLLPVLAICTTKLMEKTHHRPLLPSFGRLGKAAVRICIPLLLIVILMIVPSFLAQRSNQFLYGSSGMHSEDSEVRKQADLINGIFGKYQQMALLVPEGDIARENALTEELSATDGITSVISYTGTAGMQVPEDLLTKSQLAQFRSNGYSRIILRAATDDEGDEAFSAVDSVRSAANRYYGGKYFLVGQSVINYDLKKTITGDYLPVTLASVTAIGLVLVITFRSASIPLILLLTIEGAIWINLGLPYFTGSSLNYIGYQIIGSVQLGATVDYGILFSQRYLDKRRSADRREAARLAVVETAASILTPAGILTIAGLVLGFVSTNGIISQLGNILGRGAAISALMVLFFLPALLMLSDGLIQKTTYSAEFSYESREGIKK